MQFQLKSEAISAVHIRQKPLTRNISAEIFEKIMSVLLGICGSISVGSVVVITIFLIISGIPAIKEIGLTEFLFGTEWIPTADDPKFGIMPFILTSLYGTFGAILLGVPLGILCAVFLTKIAGKRIGGVVSGAIDLMAGIPSVVYGLVGMIVIVPTVREIFGLPDGATCFRQLLFLP